MQFDPKDLEQVKGCVYVLCKKVDGIMTILSVHDEYIDFPLSDNKFMIGPVKYIKKSNLKLPKPKILNSFKVPIKDPFKVPIKDPFDVPVKDPFKVPLGGTPFKF